MNRPVLAPLMIVLATLSAAACKDRSQSDKAPVQMPPILASAKLSAVSQASLSTKDQTMFTQLTDSVDVAPQISIEAVAAAKARGVTMIINNRPDGEDPSAPQGADIAAAAQAAGIEYLAIPVTHAGFSAPQVDAMVAALSKAEASGGKVLAYCRSGTRSTLLWSLAQAKQGASPAELTKVAAQAGYDVSPIRPMLDALSGRTD